MNRIEIAQKEAQRDPIFILRKRRFYMSEDGPYTFDGDCLRDEAGEIVTEEDVVNRGHGVFWMEADRVFLTRQEGETWGRSQAHNIGEQHVNWDIYCISAEMSLSHLLRESEESTDSIQIVRAMEMICALSESNRKRLIKTVKTVFAG